MQVALRVRPLSGAEQSQDQTQCVFCDSADNTITVALNSSYRSFTFDQVLDDSYNQQIVYDRCVTPLVDKFIEGFNATIVAYGQTGSGKSYSMGTASTDSDPGIIPRFIHHLFAAVPDAQISTTFLELHNEDLIDLLNPSAKNISIREDPQGNIYWIGAQEQSTNNPEELLSVLQKGLIARSTGATDMNQTSSRSHAIFTVILKQYISEDESSCDSANDNGGKVAHHLRQVESKFHFVDLAGSERLKRTKAVGDRFKEGISINSGLLALGNVISALGDETRKMSHVPYRDSKLTRLLQDSLGGNSQTLMLACISPSEMDVVETISTLKYANRARNIKNNVVRNIEQSGNDTDRYRRLIGRLKVEIAEQETFMNAAITEMDSLKEKLNVVCKEKEMLSSLVSDKSDNSNISQALENYAHEIEKLKQENIKLRAKSDQNVKNNDTSAQDKQHSPRRPRKRKSLRQPNRNSILRNTPARSTTTDELQGLSAIDFDGLLRHRIALETGDKPTPGFIPQAVNDSLKVLDSLKKSIKGANSRGAARSDHVALMTQAQNQIEQDIRVLLQLLSNSDENPSANRSSKQSAPKIASKSSDNKQRVLLKENQNLKQKIGELTKQHSDIKTKAEESQKKLQSQSNDFKQEKRKLLKRIKQEADRSKEKQQNLEQQIKMLQKFEDGKKRAESSVARERAAKSRSQEELQKCTSDLQSIASYLTKAIHPNVEVDRQLLNNLSVPASARSCCVQQKYVTPSITNYRLKLNNLENELNTLLSERKMVVEEELEEAKKSGTLFDSTQPIYMDERVEEVMSDINHIKNVIQALEVTVTEMQKAQTNMLEAFGKLDYSDARKVSTSLIKSLDSEEAVALLESLADEMVELQGLRSTQTALYNCCQSEQQQLKLALATINQKISQSVRIARETTAQKIDILPGILLLSQEVTQMYAKAHNIDLTYRDTDSDELSPTPATMSRSLSMLAIPTSV
ncbi:hypothetical protein INT43_004806, partial [Umbelopsis isabellina]